MEKRPCSGVDEGLLAASGSLDLSGSDSPFHSAVTGPRQNCETVFARSRMQYRSGSQRQKPSELQRTVMGCNRLYEANVGIRKGRDLREHEALQVPDDVQLSEVQKTEIDALINHHDRRIREQRAQLASDLTDEQEMQNLRQPMTKLPQKSLKKCSNY
jgi:hypothetical protein